MATQVTSEPKFRGAEQQLSLSVARKDNFLDWYRCVLKEADLAENSAVSGCMVMKPLGNGIWERAKKELDKRFQEGKCCQNYYFPIFIPVKFFEKEATHVKGFAKECAVVTHGRMKVDENGKMIPDPEAKMAEPLVVRPTSETIIGDSMNKWVQSYRDLPLLINQWANIVRMEHRTTPFVRTAEFLWQEGHCVFPNQDEAEENALKMALVYHRYMGEVCAMPTILGEKSPGERFAGADRTYCLEAMVQDGKAIQAGTSHYLGTHFAKASDIQFTDKDGFKKLAHTTSWGVSTRLIGALIMMHSDDQGLRLPPRLAPDQVVILPAGTASVERNQYIEKIAASFKGQKYADRNVRVHVDERNLNAGEKGWDLWRKGTPIRLEVGPREAQSQTVMLSRRDREMSDKMIVKVDELVPTVIQLLGAIQTGYYNKAMEFMESHIRTDIKTLEEIKDFFRYPENIGFVRAKWCGREDTEEMLKDLGVTIRCLPRDQTKTEGKCVLTGEPATIDAIFGRSY